MKPPRHVLIFFYNSDGRMSIYAEDQRLERVKNSLQRSQFTEEETDQLLAWGEHKLASGNAPNTVYKYLYCLNALAPAVDFDFLDPSQEELEDLVREIETDQVDHVHGTGDYAPSTKSQMKIAVRAVQNWLGNDDLTDFIETGVDKKDRKVWRKSDFVEPGDVPQLLDATTSARDHLLLETLWLTGGRIGEVLPLEFRDVENDGDLVEVRFRESKSEPRIVHTPPRLWNSVEEWRRWHPDPGDHAPVFVSHSTGDSLTRAQAAKIINTAVDGSDVDKDLTPHDFRRGRATYLAEQGWNEPKLMQFFGWSDPETPQRYIWLADSDLADAVRELP